MIKVKLITNEQSGVIDMPESYQITAHFRLGELANLSGDPALPMYELSEPALNFMQVLEHFRVRIDTVLDPTSVYRQVGYNARVGGDKNSLHLHGCACDFNKYKGLTNGFIIAEWLLALSDYGRIGAINLYSDHYHVEAGSDIYLGYKRSQLRIYSSDADFAKYKYMYSQLYDVKRYYK